MKERMPSTTIRLRGWGAILGCLGIIVVAFALQVWVRWVFYRYQLMTFDRSFGIGVVVFLLGVAALTWFAAWRSGPVLDRLKYSFLAGFVATVLVGTAGDHQLNAVLDTRQVDLRSYVIESLDCIRTRHRTPEFRLRAVDVLDKRLSLDVPTSVCRDALPGDRIIVAVKPGFFRSPWISQYSVEKLKR